MSAFDSFQRATVAIADGRLGDARRALVSALNSIQRTGIDAMMEDDLRSLLVSVSNRIAETPRIWRNADGTWSHHRDAQRRWASKHGAQIDLRFHSEWER